jgi:hypothetical protein
MHSLQYGFNNQVQLLEEDFFLVREEGGASKEKATIISGF